MLPVVFCAVQNSDRQAFLSQLNESAKKMDLKVSVEAIADVPDEGKEALDAIEKISVFTIGIGAKKETGTLSSAQLGRRIIQKNRDHYLIYCLDNSALLEKAAAILPHPYSILIRPLKQDLVKEVTMRLVQEYCQMTEGTDDENSFVLKDGGSCQILRKASCIYAESYDKRTNITLREQFISTAMSMNDLEAMLGDGFFRCHRSYLVNEKQIERISFSTLEIQLRTGERIPLSKRRITEAKGVLDRMRAGQ